MSDTQPVEVIVAGAAGRMGRTLLRMIANDGELVLAGALEHPESPHLGEAVRELEDEVDNDVVIQSAPDGLLSAGRVLVDFTRPEATRSFLEAVDGTDARMVIGTTGLTPDDYRLIEHVSDNTAVVQAPNMSVGINLLLDLVEEATHCLGDDFDVEILEMHHRFKEDAPSGTAHLLAETVASARHQPLEDVQKIGREGFEGERDPDEIGMASLRGGDVVGDHTVMFAGIGERIELTHRASSRETFATGALRAVKFVHEQDRGLYSMKDVLGL